MPELRNVQSTVFEIPMFFNILLVIVLNIIVLEGAIILLHNTQKINKTKIILDFTCHGVAPHLPPVKANTHP